MTNITESEMNTAWQTFDNMRNAVVEGSKLRVEFDQLKAQVAQMQAQIEKNTQYAKSLEESLASMRTARDNAVTESAGLRNENRSLTEQVRAKDATIASLQQQVKYYEERDKEISKERDEAQLSAMEWEEKANSFRAFADGIKTKLQELGLSFQVQPTEDKVLAEPIPQPQPESQAVAVPEVAAPVPPPGDSAHSTDTGPSQAGDGSGGGFDSEGRPIQPRDPVTQQWRSPYGEV